jgi:hypothetical protein
MAPLEAARLTVETPNSHSTSRSAADAEALKRAALESIKAAERSLAERTQTFTTASEAMRAEIENFEATIGEAQAQLAEAENRLSQPPVGRSDMRLVESSVGPEALSDAKSQTYSEVIELFTAGSHGDDAIEKASADPAIDRFPSRQERILFETGGALLGFSASFAFLKFVLLG